MKPIEMRKSRLPYKYEIKVFGDETDYADVEAACKAIGVEFERRPMMYRAEGVDSHEVVMICISAAVSIRAVAGAISAIAKAYEAKHKKKVCYTDGYGLHYFQNYKTEELEKVLPKTVAIYFGDAAPEDHPDYHRDDETAA